MTSPSNSDAFFDEFGPSIDRRMVSPASGVSIEFLSGRLVRLTRLLFGPQIILQK